jgi:hypothetical protein
MTTPVRKAKSAIGAGGDFGRWRTVKRLTIVVLGGIFFAGPASTQAKREHVEETQGVQRKLEESRRAFSISTIGPWMAGSASSPALMQRRPMYTIPSFIWAGLTASGNASGSMSGRWDWMPAMPPQASLKGWNSAMFSGSPAIMPATTREKRWLELYGKHDEAWRQWMAESHAQRGLSILN